MLNLKDSKQKLVGNEELKLRDFKFSWAAAGELDIVVNM